MKTEESNAQPAKVENPTALRRAGRIGLAIINPFSDFVSIYRNGIVPTFARMKLLQQLLTGRAQAGEPLTWAQAIEVSGRTVAQLEVAFKRIRITWWLLMAITGGLAIPLLSMMLIAHSDLPIEILWRASAVCLVMVCLSCVGFARALVATYRLWQLRTQRVSVEERGTFSDFRAENAWCRQVLTLGVCS